MLHVPVSLMTAAALAFPAEAVHHQGVVPFRSGGVNERTEQLVVAGGGQLESLDDEGFLGAAGGPPRPLEVKNGLVTFSEFVPPFHCPPALPLPHAIARTPPTAGSGGTMGCEGNTGGGGPDHTCHARGMDTAGLFHANRDLAEACRHGEFVARLADGTLPEAAFAFYVGQDARFLESFARAYATCAARAPDRRALGDFIRLAHGVVEELDLHAGYARRFGMDLEPPAAPATTAYTDFLADASANHAVGEICAAMTPCMRLYAWLGSTLDAVVDPDNPYREWVDTYADPGFAELASLLEDLGDRLSSDPGADPGVDWDVVAANYRRAMELERDFFAAAAAHAR